MSVIRTIKAKEKPYVTLDTTALNDARLSFRAKGLHTYLMSKPDHWQVYIDQLEKHSPREGRDAIRSAMQELLEAGYIRRSRVRGAKGLMQGWTTTVYETPGLADEHSSGLSEVPHIALAQNESPTTGYPTSDEPTSANPTSVQPTTGYPSSVQPSSANPQLVSIDLEKVLIVDPPCLPSEDIPHPAHRAPQALKHEAQTVLTYLNKVAGRKFREPGLIVGCLRRGATVTECLLVIDWWHDWKTIEDPGQVQYFTTKTPFRPENFDVYRASAESWDMEGRPFPRASPLSRAEQRNLDNIQSTLELEELLNGRKRAQNLRPDAGSTGIGVQRPPGPAQEARLLGGPRGSEA